MNIEVSKYRKKYKDKLIHKSNIDEELFLIPDSDTDYITKSGKVYKDYGNDMYYPKKPILNKTCGYIYVSITHKGNVNKSTRLHVLLARMFIHNTNPDVLKFVGHKDNDKTNYALNNLYWTTNYLESNKEEKFKKYNIYMDKAISCYYAIGLNKIAEENENSKYVKVIDYKTNEVVGVYGSLREAARCISNISLTTIAKLVSNEKDYKPRNRPF